MPCTLQSLAAWLSIGSRVESVTYSIFNPALIGRATSRGSVLEIFGLVDDPLAGVIFAACVVLEITFHVGGGTYRVCGSGCWGESGTLCW